LPPISANCWPGAKDADSGGFRLPEGGQGNVKAHCQKAQDEHDALAALRMAQRALFSSLEE